MSHMGMKHSLQLPALVEVDHWTGKKITIYTSDKIVDEYKEWCKERVGANNWNYYGQYRKKPCEFRFKRAEDLLAFKLRFGL